jgi:biopolymer transport protein TolQ
MNNTAKNSFNFKPILVQAAILVPSLLATLPSLAQAAGGKIGVKAGILDGILGAGIAVQLLLLVLIALSVTSWGIILAKFNQLTVLKAANQRFSDLFWKANSLEAVFDRIKEAGDGGMSRVYKAAFLELQRIAESGLATQSTHAGETQTRLSGLDNLERALRKAIDTEVSLAESRLGFLATTGSTAPFIGLLGTVIGIMTSFSHIASTGSASLAVVAPGISEALFSTAIGLFAALPAVAAYNAFIGQVRRVEMDLNSFGSDFLNIAKRNFFKGE